MAAEAENTKREIRNGEAMVKEWWSKTKISYLGQRGHLMWLPRRGAWPIYWEWQWMESQSIQTFSSHIASCKTTRWQILKNMARKKSSYYNLKFRVNWKKQRLNFLNFNLFLTIHKLFMLAPDLFVVALKLKQFLQCLMNADKLRIVRFVYRFPSFLNIIVFYVWSRKLFNRR